MVGNFLGKDRDGRLHNAPGSPPRAKSFFLSRFILSNELFFEFMHLRSPIEICKPRRSYLQEG